MKVISFKKPITADLITSLFEQSELKHDCFDCSNRKCETCDKNHSFYASWAGQCSRLIALNWLVGQEIIEQITYNRLLTGKLWHAGLQALLVEKGYATMIEKKKKYKDKDGFILACRADAAINVDGEKVLLEIKTVAAERINKTPYKSNILQLEIAMKLFNYDYGELIYIPVYSSTYDTFENIDKWRFYGFSKSNEGKEEIKRFKEIFKTIKQGKLPRREVSNFCSYCSKRELCFEEEIIREFFE